MKYSLIFLFTLSACSNPSGDSNSSNGTKPIRLTSPTEDIADPLSIGNQQQQTDGPFVLQRNYVGTNVVLNFNSNRNLGMIRIRGKDAEKLHKHMALTTIKVTSPFVKNDLEAKVGKHLMCRPDTCWVYLDYKNGDVKANFRDSDEAKAKKIILSYYGKNLELQMLGRWGKIFVEGMDAKALYSVMQIPEVDVGGKSSPTTKKQGDGVKCTHTVPNRDEVGEKFKCEVNFNHRSGAIR